MSRLWEVNEPTWGCQAAAGAVRTWAMRVVATADTPVARIGFYRCDTHVQPSAVVLYRADTQAVVYRDDSPTIGPVGEWSYTELDTGVNLINGVSYRVAIVCPATAGVATGNAGAPNPSAPLSFSGSPPYHFKNSDGFPDQNGAFPVYLGIDLVTGTPGPVPPDEPPEEEPNPGTLDPGGSLAYWLHQNTTNPDSLPKLTYDQLVGFILSVGDQFDIINAKLDHASTGLPSIKAQTVANGNVLDTISTDLTTLLNRLSAALVDILNGAAEAILGHSERGPWATPNDTGSGGGGSNFPAEDWTLTDTLVGSGPGTWNVDADRYVWTCTNPEVLRAGMHIDGIHYFGHRGWWAPLNVDIVGNHRPFVSVASLWYEPGTRLPGAIWHVDNEIAWTLQAYDYTPGAGAP